MKYCNEVSKIQFAYISTFVGREHLNGASDLQRYECTRKKTLHICVCSCKCYRYLEYILKTEQTVVTAHASFNFMCLTLLYFAQTHWIDYLY